ncbi:MAG: hypothetical protein E6I85_14280 [Chloroflexi bacterium]|nr:MAG: hypothetical protein E6I85_14280 [Chloroflexota bacterium]
MGELEGDHDSEHQPGQGDQGSDYPGAEAGAEAVDGQRHETHEEDAAELGAEADRGPPEDEQNQRADRRDDDASERIGNGAGNRPGHRRRPADQVPQAADEELRVEQRGVEHRLACDAHGHRVGTEDEKLGDDLADVGLDRLSPSLLLGRPVVRFQALDAQVEEVRGPGFQRGGQPAPPVSRGGDRPAQAEPGLLQRLEADPPLIEGLERRQQLLDRGEGIGHPEHDELVDPRSVIVGEGGEGTARAG